MGVKKISIEELVPYLKKPWIPLVIGRVENYEIKLAEFKGKYRWHRHTQYDECMLVYKGTINIELENNKKVKVKKGETAVIEKGTLHRSSSKGKALVIVFESGAITSDFVDEG
ncbi:MAG: cupin domain-containing protein [Planctomycetota bacterium]|nr:cupin domain-containing protein [Planctomycetota bacterium]MDI6786980.1 cupin domain-containing protein [Planctomycetota bacterium]